MNLLGEHTDYNEGFVLPATIGLGVEAAARPRSDGSIRAVALDAGESQTIVPGEAARLHAWVPYVAGLAAELRRAGLPVGGYDLVFRGDLPQGAGLASSAALGIAMILALEQIFGFRLSPEEGAKLWVDVEHEHAGVRCGVMDPLVCRAGRAGQALLVDCRTMERRPAPLPSGRILIVIVDSGIRRRLAASAYNRRREECASGAAILRRADATVRTLRDAGPALLDACAASMPPRVAARCRHVLSENGRVLRGVEHLARGEWEAFGRLITESHRSLRDDFEVSHPVIDRLVESANMVEGVLGSRITGAGFGGCMVSLVTRDALGEFRRRVEPLLAGRRAGAGVIVVEDAIEAGPLAEGLC